MTETILQSSCCFIFFFFLLNITSSLSWVKVLSTQLLWSRPAPPAGVTSWEKRKRKEKTKAAWSALSSLHTHPLSPMQRRQTRTHLDGTAARHSRNGISRQCDSNCCHYPPAPTSPPPPLKRLAANKLK